MVCLLLASPWGSGWRGDAPTPALAATPAAYAPSSPSSALPTIPIEQIRLGDWALAHNPELSDADRASLSLGERAGVRAAPEEAPDDWRRVSLRMEKSDGSDLLIELLRPVDWLHWHDARLGGVIELDLEELGAAGPALVLAIEPCPPIRPQPAAGYRLVTGRFAHASADVLDLVLAGADGATTTLGVTSNHPFWSQDAQAFVPAGALTPDTQRR